MKQSAVSRIEQANYSGWNFKTLARIADSLDARLRIVLEASEDVIARYLEDESRLTSQAKGSQTIGLADLIRPMQAVVEEQKAEADLFADVQRLPYANAVMAGIRNRGQTAAL